MQVFHGAGATSQNCGETQISYVLLQPPHTTQMRRHWNHADSSILKSESRPDFQLCLQVNPSIGFWTQRSANTPTRIFQVELKIQVESYLNKTFFKLKKSKSSTNIPFFKRSRWQKNSLLVDFIFFSLQFSVFSVSLSLFVHLCNFHGCHCYFTLSLCCVFFLICFTGYFSLISFPPANRTKLFSISVDCVCLTRNIIKANTFLKQTLQ